MTEPPAPEKLSLNLFCRCKSGCRKPGLNTNKICLNCCGVNCSNGPQEDNFTENISEIKKNAAQTAEILKRRAKLTEDEDI